MFTKIAVLLALLAAAVQVTLAAPPACLIAAMGQQDNPSAVSDICSKNATSVEGFLSSNCGDSQQPAVSAFQAACRNAGVTVSIASSTATSSSQHASSSHGTASSTRSGTATATDAHPGEVTPTATGPATGSASVTTSTGGSGASLLALPLNHLAAIGLVGAALAF